MGIAGDHRIMGPSILEVSPSDTGGAVLERDADLSVETVVSERDIASYLSLLEDDDCRSILSATNGDSKTASEVERQCDIPLSTAYRKLERLSRAGWLREGLRVCRSGKHSTEYTRRLEAVTVSMDGTMALFLRD